MSDFFNALISFIEKIAKYLLDGVLWLAKTIIFMVVDGVLTVVTLVFQTLDFSAFLASYAMDWAGLPTQAIYLICAIGIPQGLTIISGAMLLRLGLNLIPAAFTRV